MIIYMASYQHSAVNYFQDEYMGYLPNAPSCLAKAPDSNLTMLTEESLIEALPTPRVADLASATLKMLSDPPENNHSLSEFKSNEGNNDFVEWVNAATKLQEMQSDLRNGMTDLNDELR